MKYYLILWIIFSVPVSSFLGDSSDHSTLTRPLSSANPAGRKVSMLSKLRIDPSIAPFANRWIAKRKSEEKSDLITLVISLGKLESLKVLLMPLVVLTVALKFVRVFQRVGEDIGSSIHHVGDGAKDIAKSIHHVGDGIHHVGDGAKDIAQSINHVGDGAKDIAQSINHAANQTANTFSKFSAPQYGFRIRFW